MEAEVDGDTALGRGVGERGMQGLSIGYYHVARLADHGHGAGQPVGAVGVDHRFDVHFALFVGAGEQPDAVLGCAAV